MAVGDDKPGEEAEGPSDKMELMTPKKMTRFQVNKVDLSMSNPEELNKLWDDNVEDTTTNYAKSFRHFTREALPRLDNYRNIMSIQAVYRPTLDDLHEDNSVLPPCKTTSVPINDSLEDKESHKEQLGWFRGVYIKNLLHLWGIIFYLRLSWTLGQAGILEGMLIILSSSGLAFITALSVSAISSNGLAQGGGAYVMISRSLGPEFGASIGLIFSFANSMLTSMFIIGISELLVTSFSLELVDGGVQDIRILGVLIICVLLGCALSGVTLGYKVRVVVFFVLAVSILNILLGSILSSIPYYTSTSTNITSSTKEERGLKGFSLDVLQDNLFSSYSPGYNFFTVLGVYFPAIIGFLNGANSSKELKDPCCDIPKGTLYALLTGTASYVLVGLTSAAVMIRTVTPSTPYASTPIVADMNSTSYTLLPKYGLREYFESLELISAFSPLFYSAVLTSGLTCAFSSLQEAPRVFRHLSKDGLYPYIGWFGRGKTSRPHVLTTGIAAAFILVGNLNDLAPLISTPFLAAYALVNFSVFHASLIQPIGWRPTFKLYNMWLSLSGAILCMVVMFLICWITALFTLILILAMYLIIVYRKPDVNWGSTTQAQTYRSALEAVQSLNHVEEHVKNYQPQILVLCGLPSARPALVDFANLISKNISLLVCGHITKVKVPEVLRKSLYDKARHYLSVHKIKAFYTHVDEDEFDVGAKALLQCTGLGKLRPNTLMMGYKTDWTHSKHELQKYFNVIHMVLDNYKAMCILRVKGGFDYSSVLADTDPLSRNGVTTPPESLSRNVSASQFSHGSSSSDSVTSIHTAPHLNSHNSHIGGGGGDNKNHSKIHPVPLPPPIVSKKSKQDLYKAKDGSELPKEIFNDITQFQRKHKKSTIDVWWLYDDGGLTLLLPYIISTRHSWASCKLRVFALANRKEELEFEQRNIASLLAKFRIDYADLIIITTITRRPHEETVEFYNHLVRPYLAKDEEADCGDAVRISESELAVLKDKTNRQLRLRELLLENSLDSDLIVMTLPMPRKNIVSAPIYMSWLEALTRDMPNFLLVRGNQTSVLTFYS
ncbi:hypothetical protein M8J77_007896 [Diaphorina citri]|nr:hypothetical protein M8J77_007896 [Diaphorina citri]